MSGTLFVISASSGAGKTSLLQDVLPRINSYAPFKQVVTYTSRAPRPGERDGIDYHFVSSLEFEKKIKEGFFLEWSGAYGHYYGSPAGIIQELASGISYSMVLDRNGAQAVRKKVPHAVLIWITVSSIEVLRNRLVMRGSESAEQIERRLAIAYNEMEQEKKEALYDVYIDNTIFSSAAEHLFSIFISNFSHCFQSNKKEGEIGENQG